MCWWVKLGVLIALCHYSVDGQFTCHCKNSEACNTNTGECANECADYWTGPGCQYRDLALRQSSRHLDNTDPAFTAYLANDDSLTTCSNTDDLSAGATRTYSPWWRVYFNSQNYVRGLIISAKSLVYFQRGFNITVETIPDNQKTNSGFYPDASNVRLCYSHQPGTTLLSTFEIYCTDTLVGNQVRIQLSDKNTQLVLCEVNIFDIACPGLQWGKLCQNTCGHCADNAQCDVITGVCRTGCSAGYKTLALCTEECDAGSYGQGCVNRCSLNCNTVCNHVSGSCNWNCKPGWKGESCAQECDAGSYGQGCVNRCSLNCNTVCNHVSGSCNWNCKPGWKGESCAQECDAGSYGQGCVNRCSLNCNTVCNHVSGSCNWNCKPGWKGESCAQECTDGTYGAGCGQQCSSNCRGGFQNCYHVTGVCMQNCNDGWQSSHCNTACAFGYYGNECRQKCSKNCLYNNITCNHVNGKCEGGCVVGWTEDTCKEECTDGTYGAGCNQQCSSNCRGGFQYCHHVTGNCTQNCSDGWQGSQCNAECSDGTYGERCKQNCSSNCRGGFQNCHHVTGNCTEKCKDGWLGTHCIDACDTGFYGNECRQECSTNCLYDNITCDFVNGKCEGGCVAGWAEDNCKEECHDGKHGVNCSGVCGNCAGGTACDKTNGTCLQGCSGDFTGVFCLQQLTKEDPPSSPIGGIIGGILAVVAVIGATVLVVFLYRRRQTRQRRQHSPPAEISESREIRDTTYANSTVFMDIAECKDLNDTEQDNGSIIENAVENVYYNNMEGCVPKSAIYLSDLKEYVIKQSKTSKLEDEFKSIPYGLQYPTTAALKPANRSKNRYKDMYPYDHSRVILKPTRGDSDSDFINACNVDGYKTEKTYIAAQGPTTNNIVDFWRMIWEKNVDTIVMVTNPVEMGKMKCMEYWNNKDEETRFHVTVTSEETFDMIIVRQMQFTLASYKGNKTVTQFHFTAWPDKGTPDRPTGLVQFFLKCRKNYANKVSPIVVHCSAGVGRTGTFIALDYLYEQGKDLGYVDVYGVVQKLRQQRVNAVQTKGQYVFLHEVVHEALVLPSPMSSLEFPENYSKLLQENEATRKSRLQEQYEDIGDMLLSENIRNKMNDITEDGDDFSASKDPENETRNRYADISVANEFRPFLSTSVEGCNNYINAVFVQSHRDSHGFLLSQAPLAYTAVDYCRLILERSITCIVSFDYDQLKQNEKYLPSKGKLTIGPFETYFESKEEKEDFILNRHRLVYKGKSQDVQHLVYEEWPADQKVPTKMTSFLKMVEAVQDIQRSTEGPILVQCLNGAEKCGMFVVLLNVMERMRIEQDIAIPQTIRLTRRRRQQIIPNYEQYRFCHDAVLYHVEEDSTYANV